MVTIKLTEFTTSLYTNWKQLLSDDKNWGWFADTVFTYGDMSYSSNGRDGNLSAGGDYNGRSWLIPWDALERNSMPHASSG